MNNHSIHAKTSITHTQLHYEQQLKSDRHAARAHALEVAAFNLRSRYLILVLTLGYKTHWRRSMTPYDIARDRDKLFNNMRCNQLLIGIRFLVWKIEEGGKLGGLHIHFVIFYDGAHFADEYIARQIGEYWENVVTQGRGDYWNSNAHKTRLKYSRWGDATGQIDRSNIESREALRAYLINYIAKNDQHVLSGVGKHYRTFGTSQFPIE